MIDTLPVGIILQQAEGKIVAINQEAQRIIGISINEMEGKNIADLQWKLLKADGSELPHEEHPAMVALRSGKPVNGFIMGIVHPHDQMIRWVKVSVSNRFQESDKKVCQVCTTFFEINNSNQIPEKI